MFNRQSKETKRKAHSQESSPENIRSFENRQDLLKSLTQTTCNNKKAIKIQEKQYEKHLAFQGQQQEQPASAQKEHNIDSLQKQTSDTFESNMSALFAKYDSKMQEFQKIIQEQNQIIMLQKDQISNISASQNNGVISSSTSICGNITQTIENPNERAFNHGASAFGLAQLKSNLINLNFQTMPTQPPELNLSEAAQAKQKAPSSVNQALFERISTLVSDQNKKNDKMISKAKDHQEKIKNQNQKLKMISNFFCAKCKIPFNDLETLKRHRSNFHQDTFYEEGSSELLFTCEVCQIKSFTSKSGYEAHKQSCLRSYIQMINQQAGSAVLQLKQYSDQDRDLIQLAKRSLRDDD